MTDVKTEVCDHKDVEEGEAAAAPSPSRMKMQFDDWEHILPLLHTPEIDFDAVDACLERVLVDRSMILSQARTALRVLKDNLEGKPIDLADTKMIEAKAILSFLVVSGRVDTARDYVQAAKIRWDETRFRETGAALFPPKWPGGLPSMIDRPWIDHQVFDRGSKNTILLFGGLGGFFGMETNALLMWFDKIDCNLVILRDMHFALFFSGVKSIGNFDETLAAMRSDVERLGTERLVCMGSSGGGYNALIFGDLLKADAVYSFSGPTALDYGIENADDRPMYAKLLSQIERGELVVPDIAQAYRTNGILTRLYYGGKNVRDTMEAKRLKGIPTVKLRPVKGWARHQVYQELARRRLLAGIFRKIATG